MSNEQLLNSQRNAVAGDQTPQIGNKITLTKDNSTIILEVTQILYPNTTTTVICCESIEPSGKRGNTLNLYLNTITAGTISLNDGIYLISVCSESQSES